MIVFAKRFLSAALCVASLPLLAVEPAEKPKKAEAAPKKEARKTAPVRRTTIIYVRPRPANPWAYLAGSVAGAITREVIESRRAAREERLYQQQLQSEERSAGASTNPYSPKVAAFEPTPKIEAQRIAPVPVLAFPVATFESEPRGAEVRVDGEYAGTTPTAEIRQRDGRHKVTFSKPGYVTWAQDIEMVPGEPKLVRIDLTVAAVDPDKPKIFGLN